METSPLALVMGDIDLVHALAPAGIRSALFAERSSPARFSRDVVAVLPFANQWHEPERVVQELCAFGRSQPAAPVLMPQTDGDLLVASRHRDRLAPHVRLVLADAELIEELVDKASFSALAARLDLPVPASAAADPGRFDHRDLPFAPPMVVKPMVRDAVRWSFVEPDAKAVLVETPAELDALWRRLADAGVPVLVQELVEGPESRIESYHVYVDADGDVAGEVTGRKIRTLPARFGHTTALEVTDAHDVRRLGRDVVERIGLRGVAKVDFKRAPDGDLRLLEVNARFSLWHLPAALAGVNLAALAYADATGRQRPPVERIRPGVRWVVPHRDVRAARASGMRISSWLRWAVRCEAISGLSRRDPLPFAVGVPWSVLTSRLPART